jgi:chemotaxis protein MotB
MGKLPNHIVIEGHTDAKPFSNTGTYSNWELSADRANSARRFMVENGLRTDQVKQVRGFADQQLRDSKDPENPSNRRVSVIVQYLKR